MISGEEDSRGTDAQAPADPIMAELKAQQRAAWDARDLDTFGLYHAIEMEITELRIVGRAVASLYKNTSNEDAWNALYEALSDAGLLSE